MVANRFFELELLETSFMMAYYSICDKKDMNVLKSYVNGIQDRYKEDKDLCPIMMKLFSLLELTEGEIDNDQNNN